MVKIPKRICVKRSTGNGASCFYLPLTGKTGLKVFKNELECERCYAIHRFLFDHPTTRDLVPRIRGEVVKVGRRWAYAVETVKTYENGGKDELAQKAIRRKIDELTEYQSLRRFQKLVIETLNDAPKNTFPNFVKLFSNVEIFKRHVKDIFYDDHEGNVGLKNGKLIWIDFSISL